MHKICHIISGDLWAGAEVMSYNLLYALSEHSDVSLSILLLNEGRLGNELRGAGLEVHVFDESRYSFAQLARRIRDFIKIEAPEIVHAHRYKENLLAFAAVIGLCNTRLVTTQHGLPEFPLGGLKLGQSFKTWMNFFLLSHFFAKTVAVSRDIGYRLVQEYGFHEERVAVIHNGVPMPSANAHRESVPYLLSIGSSGRLFPVKDYPLMVEIARIVAEKKNVRFELAGEGPIRSEIESLVEGYQLQETFALRGHLEDMDAFYRGLDIYINTSLHEGIPMTILEAMARGVPVIAPDVGGISEILDHGVQGFLVPGRDPADFASRCLELVQDDALRTAMSRAARDKASKVFSAEQMAISYYQLYLELLAP